ncbi:hypothetical protein KBD45_08550 [Candidatus Dojkabacteria bacterium]|nr:hypothetical protein [Candidatus Dojkabacteria bacterium]
MDRKNNDDRLASAPKDSVSDFIQKNKNNIAVEFEKRIKATLGHNNELLDMALDDLTEIVEREVDFVTNIINSYDRWSDEEAAIVLWDIDDTLGKVHSTKESSVWRFRPSMVELLDFLSTEYPNVKNGIISNRADVTNIFNPDGPLNEISKYFDKQLLISTRELKLEGNISAEIEQEVKAMNLPPPDTDCIAKFSILKTKRNEGLNIKIIDNNVVAKAWGVHGVYVGGQFQNY